MVHVNRGPYDVYVGRSVTLHTTAPGTPGGGHPQHGWGNPFPMAKGRAEPEARDEAVGAYQQWLMAPERSSLREEARTHLRGKTLGCHCAPRKCHGEILLQVANSPPEKVEQSGGSAHAGSGPASPGQKEARAYLDLLEGIGTGTAQAWVKLLDQGTQLLRGAGSPEGTAQELWDARLERGGDNLQGVEDEAWCAILPKDMLRYLRSVRRKGVPLRSKEVRTRISAKPHASAIEALEKIYDGMWDDLTQGRVLVCWPSKVADLLWGDAQRPHGSRHQSQRRRDALQQSATHTR